MIPGICQKTQQAKDNLEIIESISKPTLATKTFTLDLCKRTPTGVLLIIILDTMMGILLKFNRPIQLLDIKKR